MDQVSRPLLGLLLAVVGLAGTWMVALRPHAANTNVDAPLVAPKLTTAPKAATPAAPGVKGLGRAIDHAKGAVGTSEQSNARAEAAAKQIHDAPAVGAAATPAAAAAPAKTTAPAKAATPAPATAPAATATPAAPATPAKAAVPAPKPITQSGSARVNAILAGGRSVVLLFAGNGADDRLARDVVRSVRGPHVRAVVASIHDLGQYADVTASLDITAAPTIVVIAPSRQAMQIVGLPDYKQIQSALRTVSSRP